MANKKISELTAATTTNSTDETVLAVSGTSKKITMANLIDGIIKYLTTSAKGLTGVDDSNGNEILKFTGVASAVNEVTFTNAASGSAPTISATGGDTNADLALVGKGTGQVKFGTAGIKFPNSDGIAGAVLATDGSGNMSFTASSVIGLSTTTTTHTVTHNLGRLPRRITFDTAIHYTPGTSSSGRMGSSYGVYTQSSSFCVFHNNGSDGNSSFSYAQDSGSTSGNNRVVMASSGVYFTIGSVTTTQFTLTLTGSNITSINIIWEAE